MAPSGFTVGDRVYGGVMERAAADFVVMKAHARKPLFHTPEGLSDEVASTLYIAGATASAALAAIDLGQRTRFWSAGQRAAWAFSSCSWLGLPAQR